VAMDVRAFSKSLGQKADGLLGMDFFGESAACPLDPQRRPLLRPGVTSMRFLSSCLSVACVFLFLSEIRGQQNLPTPSSAKDNAIPFHLVGGFLIEVEGGIGCPPSLGPGLRRLLYLCRENRYPHCRSQVKSAFISEAC
jgi:hypothetical protein